MIRGPLGRRSAAAVGGCCLLALCLAASAAQPPTVVCAQRIAAFQRLLRERESRGLNGAGTAPQSIGAQLEHQPTPRSIESARKEAKASVAAALREAKMLDAEGKTAACEATLETARLLLSP